MSLKDDKNGGQDMDESPKFILVEVNAPKADDHDDGKSIGRDKQSIIEEVNNKQQQKLTGRSPKEEPNSPAEVMYTEYDDDGATPSNKLVMPTQADQEEEEDMIFEPRKIMKK